MLKLHNAEHYDSKKNHNLTLYQIAISYWEFNPIQRLIVCKVFSFWISCFFDASKSTLISESLR